MANDNKKKDGTQDVNLMDVVLYLLAKWRWYVLSMVVCLGIALLQYERMPRVFFRSASVIIKDPQNETSSSAGLDRYEKYINKVNVANEILQFKGKTIMREVVRRLDANVSYQVDVRLFKKEMYKNSPIIVTFVDDQTPESFAYLDVTPIDDKKVMVKIAGENEKPFTMKLGTTVKTSIGKIKITPTPNYRSYFYDMPVHVTKMSETSAMLMFRGSMSVVQPDIEASIITISMQDACPERAEDIINTLITVYNEEAIKDKNQVAVNTANFINERLIIIAKELGGVEGNLESYKRENLVMEVNTKAQKYEDDAYAYNKNIMQLETQLRMVEFMKDYLVDPSHDLDLIPTHTGIGDAGVEAMINQYNSTKLQRDKLILDSSDENPVVQELNNKLHTVKQGIIRSVDNIIVSINTRKNDATSYMARADARFSAMPTKEREMLSIERQQKIKEELYIFLLNRREENAISQAMADNNARVVDGAEGPSGPIAPVKNKIMLVGGLIGLALPTIILLIVMFMDTRVHTRRDIKNAVNAPFLGEIPLDKKTRKASRKDEKAIIMDKDSLVAEALRILRTNMQFMTKKDHPVKVITLASFNVGAGKTFVTRNLAQSYLFANKKVVLLDLDIRKGTLTSSMGVKHVGVTNYLADESISIDDIIWHDEAGKLPDLVPAGAIAPNPAELLMDKRLDDLVDELKQRYDIIIADNVPIGLIADSGIVNRIADITLFIVRAGRMDKRQLPDIEQLYEEKKLKNMAIVLNGIDVDRWGYGYGSYGYGYGYGGYGYGYGYGGYGYGYGYGYGHKHKRKHRPWYKKMWHAIIGKKRHHHHY